MAKIYGWSIQSVQGAAGAPERHSIHASVKVVNPFLLEVGGPFDVELAVPEGSLRWRDVSVVRATEKSMDLLAVGREETVV